jgi:hypothetical protein
MTPQVPPAPAKKGSNGCLIALAVAAGIALVACLIGGAALWKVSQNPEIKRAMNAAGKGIKLVTKGASAPGAAEVKALGCQQAFVLDATEMFDLLDEFVDGGSAEDRTEFAGMMIFCQTRSTGPSCEQIATTYAKAAAPAEPFMVTVSKASGAKGCEAKFTPSGAPIEQ